MNLTIEQRIQGDPAITDWCPRCRCRCIPLDGRCGFCNQRTQPAARPVRHSLPIRIMSTLSRFGPSTVEEVADTLGANRESVRCSMGRLAHRGRVDVVELRASGGQPLNVWDVAR